MSHCGLGSSLKLLNARLGCVQAMLSVRLISIMHRVCCFLVSAPGTYYDMKNKFDSTP